MKTKYDIEKSNELRAIIDLQDLDMLKEFLKNPDNDSLNLNHITNAGYSALAYAIFNTKQPNHEIILALMNSSKIHMQTFWESLSAPMRDCLGEILSIHQKNQINTLDIIDIINYRTKHNLHIYRKPASHNNIDNTTYDLNSTAHIILSQNQYSKWWQNLSKELQKIFLDTYEKDSCNAQNIIDFACKYGCLEHLASKKLQLVLTEQDLRNVDLSKIDLTDIKFIDCDLYLTNIAKNPNIYANISNIEFSNEKQQPQKLLQEIALYKARSILYEKYLLKNSTWRRFFTLSYRPHNKEVMNIIQCIDSGKIKSIVDLLDKLDDIHYKIGGVLNQCYDQITEESSKIAINIGDNDNLGYIKNSPYAVVLTNN